MISHCFENKGKEMRWDDDVDDDDGWVEQEKVKYGSIWFGCAHCLKQHWTAMTRRGYHLWCNSMSTALFI